MTVLTQIAETPGRGSKRQLLVGGARPLVRRFYTVAFDSSYPTGGEDISSIFGDFKSVVQITTSDNLGTTRSVIDYSTQKIMLFTGVGVNEIQTLSLTGGAAADTFKLTFNGHESSAAVTIPVTDYHDVTAAQIKACLLTISDWATNTADIQVLKSTDDYIITFINELGGQDIGAITVTTKVGAADGSVAETVKGVTAQVTDTTSEATKVTTLQVTGY